MKSAKHESEPKVIEPKSSSSEEKSPSQSMKLKFMQNADLLAKKEEKQSRLKRKLNLIENPDPHPEPPADNILIEEDDESDEQEDNPYMRNPVLEISDKKQTGVNLSMPEQANPLNPLLSSAELSDYNESTYRSAASEFGTHEKKILSPKEGGRNVTFSKEGKEEGKFESPQVNSRIVQAKVDSKVFRNLAYSGTKIKERKMEPPTTADTHINVTTDPSTNITKQNYTMNKIEELTPSRPEPTAPGLAREELKDECKKTPGEKVTTSISASTLRPVSLLSSHPSLGQSSTQPFDSHKLLQSLKDKYKIAENRDPNASSYNLSTESPQFKASELVKEKQMSSASEEKPMSTTLKVQQLSVGSKEQIEEPKQYASFGAIGDPLGYGGDYKESLKDFLRVYIDNRLPEHMKSYKSPARMFKTRFYQRFYDKYTPFMDEDVQIATYYEHMEHAKPVLSESRAKLYQSQLAETMKKSEHYFSKLNV